MNTFFTGHRDVIKAHKMHGSSSKDTHWHIISVSVFNRKHLRIAPVSFTSHYHILDCMDMERFFSNIGNMKHW